MFFKISIECILVCFCLACGNNSPKNYWGDINNGEEPSENPNVAKPRYIWIDAAANFPDFADNKENIARDLALAKDAGFTDIVVDVRPTTGDVLFRTSIVDQVRFLYAWVNGHYTKIVRNATWDYLQAFIDEARKQKLRVHAAINTFIGGNSIDGGTGLLHRDPSKKGWATQLNTETGIVNVMDTGEKDKFFNPAHFEVQEFLCNLLKDLAKYDLDGIILDRGRYLNLQSDFSDYSREQFEAIWEVFGFKTIRMRYCYRELRDCLLNIPSILPNGWNFELK
ncbi:transcriptional regulator, TetR family [Bacteroides pyogenes JCM 6292]|uniref:Transporter n=2 Tax=Bacteroides pyogenes TaxID=310300 RepID=W4PKD2_9BACE|nr:transcriptional regulator, TetR family [Bacteroides pyogenes JCM 6292]GAE20237.1 transporter [Bacteroides pyogenes DSM 20611 = JCM 6294]